MCFRPPDVQLKALKCPDCGKRINNPNYRPEKCPFCGAYLPPELDGIDKVLTAEQIEAMRPADAKIPPKIESPNAPKAPKTPASPKAPEE